MVLLIFQVAEVAEAEQNLKERRSDSMIKNYALHF